MSQSYALQCNCVCTPFEGVHTCTHGVRAAGVYLLCTPPCTSEYSSARDWLPPTCLVLHAILFKAGLFHKAWPDWGREESVDQPRPVSAVPKKLVCINELRRKYRVPSGPLPTVLAWVVEDTPSDCQRSSIISTIRLLRYYQRSGSVDVSVGVIIGSCLSVLFVFVIEIHTA